MMNSNILSTLCETYPIIKKFLPKYEFKFFGFEGDKQQTLFFNNKEHKIIQIIKKDSYNNKIQISHIDNNENYFRDDNGPEIININEHNRYNRSDLNVCYGYGKLNSFKYHNCSGPAQKRFDLTTGKHLQSVHLINDLYSRFDGPYIITNTLKTIDTFIIASWAINGQDITYRFPIVFKDKLYYKPNISCYEGVFQNETFKSLDDLVIIKNHNNHLINQALILETSLFNREYGKYISELFKQNKIGA